LMKGVGLQLHLIDGFRLQNALPSVPHRSHTPIRAIIKRRFGQISIYRGAFGLKGEPRGPWCPNRSRKPISTRIILEQSAPPDVPAPWPAPAPSCTRGRDSDLRLGTLGRGL
jgi:hypothetical protein